MSNTEELYDEFGNYIGPDLDDSSSESDASEITHHASEAAIVPMDETEQASEKQPTAIVLHEDKEHYESAEQVYGKDVNTVVLDEDAMDIDTPIMEPVIVKSQHHESGPELEYHYTDEYLGVHLANPNTRTRRGVALVGHLLHGKSSLIDLLNEPSLVTSFGPQASQESPRVTDTLQSERDRKMSLASTPMTTLLTDTRGKSFCVTMIDTPGHVNFHDEAVAALRLVDGAVLVVDVVEGVRLHTECVIRQAVSEGLPLTLVLTKMDRLIVELKLPPNDAYFKCKYVIDQVNSLVQRASNGRYPIVSPEEGNVAFASALHGWLFTLSSFTLVYLEHNDGLGKNVTQDAFSRRLWGDVFIDPETGQYKREARDCSVPGVKRTFVKYILEPLYKIYSACLGEPEDVVNKTLRSIGVLLSKEQLRSSPRRLLRFALNKFLSAAHGGFCDMIIQKVPCPADAALGKVARCYTGPRLEDNKIWESLRACDPAGPLIMHAVKNYPSSDGQSFYTLARIYSGTVRPVTPVKVLGENFHPSDDDEDMSSGTVEGISIPRGKNRTNVSIAIAGNWVLLEGVDVPKTATLVAPELLSEEVHIFKPLSFPQVGGESVMKLSIEPLNPSDLPKMVDGLRFVSKAYPMARTKVEESGEHVLLGTGELYMDCLMHDLRNVYANIEIKVSDPIVTFRETVGETSSLKCTATTTNNRNKFSMIAEPLDEGLSERLESGKISLEWDKKKLGNFFQSQYNWDLLSSRSIWAFGDSPTHGTNILMDDTMPSEVDKGILKTCRNSIVQGFQWATREGPLCEEPVRATKLRILDAVLADKPIHRGGGQVIPTLRRTVHSALLTATPRLLEPVNRLEIQCPVALVDSLSPVLKRRRGHIVQDRPIPGSLFAYVQGFIPVLDSFGFETDLRTYTQDKAAVLQVFDHWAVVPGDPLDKRILLHPLEPSPPHHLARELLIKTRRRKGLSEDVAVTRYFDEEMKAQFEALEESS